VGPLKGMHAKKITQGAPGSFHRVIGGGGARQTIFSAKAHKDFVEGGEKLVGMSFETKRWHSPCLGRRSACSSGVPGA
jgi:hypothetical protein